MGLVNRSVVNKRGSRARVRIAPHLPSASRFLIAVRTRFSTIFRNPEWSITWSSTSTLLPDFHDWSSFASFKPFQVFPFERPTSQTAPMGTASLPDNDGLPEMSRAKTHTLLLCQAETNHQTFDQQLQTQNVMRINRATGKNVKYLRYKTEARYVM